MRNGKYIGFIDSDDYISNEYIQKLMNRALEKNADIVKCGYYAENLDSHEKHAILYKDLSVNRGLENQILELNGFLWGAVIKNELFSDFRIPENFWYEDMITRVIIYRKCRRFEFLNEPLYYYVQHEGNISKKVEKSNDVKCLDQYFLGIKLYELSNKIGLKKDEILYKILLNEFGMMLWSRTRKVNKKIRRKVFLCACEFLNQFKVNHMLSLTEMEGNYVIAFEKHNYLLWKLSSQYIRWSKKG